MKRVIILILSILFLSQYGYSLEPTKVAFIYTASDTISVQVKLSANGSVLFTGEPLTNVTANGSGVVIINVQDYVGSVNQWANFASSDVSSNHTLDIYVNGTLFSQQRLDQLIKMQSSTSAFDNEGNLNPPMSNSSLGSDNNRWEDAYIGSNTLHVGPDGGMTGSTEMALSYNAGEGQIAVDGTIALAASASGITIPNSLTLTNLSGSGDRTLGVDNSGNIVINTDPNVTAGNGLTIDVSNDLDVGGSATIIANADNIEVNSSANANEVLLSSGTVGSAATFGAVPLGNSNSVSGTLSVTNGGTGASSLVNGNFLQGNGTNAVTATKAVPTGDVIGTTDTQTLTNKSIDSDSNTITNIVNANIKSNAVIDATKLADGSVTNAELQFINTVTSNVQTQLDGKQPNLPDSTGKSGQYLQSEDGILKWATVSGGSGGGGAFTSASGSITATTAGDNLDMEDNNVLNVSEISGSSTTDVLTINSLISQEIGVGNTVFGTGSLNTTTTGTGNTVFGTSSMSYNTNGANNTAVGNSALTSNLTGGSNTATGYFAGNKITTGSNNIFIGAESGSDVTQKIDAENSIAIGANTYTTADNQVVLGDGNITETQLRGVKLMDLAGTGTRNIGVDSDGKIVEVAAGGGGNNLPEVTKLEYTGSDILIDDIVYVDIPNITLALEANSTYMVKGILGAVKVGGGVNIKVKLGYSGTIDLCLFTLASTNSMITNESPLYYINNNDRHSVDAIIKTTSAGTFQLQVKKVNGANSNITNETKFVLIKVQ